MYPQTMHMYQEIAHSIAESIERGGLKSGDKIPSTRQLAARLGVARNTVLQAFALLESQKYVETRSGLGTIVLGGTASYSSHLVKDDSGFSTQDLHNSYAHAIESVADLSPNRQKSSGHSTFGDLPRIRSLFFSSLRSKSTLEALESDAYNEFGLKVLREAISKYLSRLVGVHCDYSDVAIFPSRRSALEAILRLFVCQDDDVLLINENSADLKQLLQVHRANQTTLETGENGVDVEALSRVSPSQKLVFVNKSQYMCGTKSEIEKNRVDLLKWAAWRSVLIVEDGTTTEHLITKHPIKALHALDDRNSVIYLYNLELLFAPLTRMCVLVLPKSAVPHVRQSMLLSGLSCSLIEQHAIARVLGSGVCEHLLRERQDGHRRQRNLLVQKIAHEFGPNVKVEFTITGLRMVCAASSEGRLLDWCDGQGLTDCIVRSNRGELVVLDLSF